MWPCESWKCNNILIKAATENVLMDIDAYIDGPYQITHYPNDPYRSFFMIKCYVWIMLQLITSRSIGNIRVNQQCMYNHIIIFLYWLYDEIYFILYQKKTFSRLFHLIWKSKTIQLIVINKIDYSRHTLSDTFLTNPEWHIFP